MNTEESIFSNGRKQPLRTWPQLMHRKVGPRLIEELEDSYPEFEFEIMTIFEKSRAKSNTIDGNRVRIYTDLDGVVVEIPRNG